MAIASAVLALVGHRAWWLPRILGWVLPNVDIEGESPSRRAPISTADPRATVSRGPIRRPRPVTTKLAESLPPSRRTSSWQRESAVLVTAFLFCLSGGVFHVDDTVGWPAVTAYVIAALSSAALPTRHSVPVLAVALTTVCAMLVAPVGLLLTPLTVVPVAIAVYAFAVHTERTVTVALLLCAVALLVTVTSLFGALSWQDGSRLAAVAALPLIAGVLGNATQSRRAYLAAMEERARHAEKSRESEARRRVAEERVRIARELHDLVAHQITLANAQAMVGAHVFDSRPEQSRKSLEDLVETTSNALDDLRATVGLLRQSGDTAAPVEPSPGLSRLPALVESFRRTGLEVTVQHQGPARPLPPGVDLTAYRIVQEALTNVTKHARGGRARVRLVWGRHRVSITVADDGRDPRAAPNPLTDQGAFAWPDRPPGYGLIGMRERATAVGGQLSAGKSPEGGFIVSTHLPLPHAKDTKTRVDAAPATDGRMAGRVAKNGRSDDAPAGDLL